MSEREEWVELIRNEYDPKPDLGRASYPAFDSEWDDGAGRIADAIIADKTILLNQVEHWRERTLAAEAALIAAENELANRHGDGEASTLPPSHSETP